MNPHDRALRQVLLLAGAQALFQSASVGVMTVGGLAGALSAPSPQLATFPIGTMFLGTALLTIPAAAWMARVGRRPGFVAGAALGVLAGLVAALGIHSGSFWMLCVGTFLMGAYQAFAQFYRFAAGEVADDAFRPRAISLVLAGGVAAAFLGPLVSRWGGPLLHTLYAGSFVLIALASLAAACLLTRLEIPAPPVIPAGSGRPLITVVSQPGYLVALFGAATGYGVMIMAMTATPMAMMRHEHSLADAASVIQMHVLGMFVPSFFTGSLIARFGVLRIMLCGVAILGGHVLVSLTGSGFQSFAGAMVLLGVGWNFLFVGGTTLLTSTYNAAEKAGAQAACDMTIFAVGMACSLAAAPLLHLVGWQGLNLALLPWLALAAAALCGFATLRGRSTSGHDPAGAARA